MNPEIIQAIGEYIVTPICVAGGVVAYIYFMVR